MLQELGATVTTVESPWSSAYGRTSILLAGATAYHADSLRERPEDYGESVRGALLAGQALSAVQYINDQRARRRWITEAAELLRTIDVLVSPTTATTAPSIETGDPAARLARLTAPYDVLGIPAISLPCGFDKDGLPIGLMIGGRHFDEATVCRVAHAYEQATSWSAHQPAL